MPHSSGGGSSHGGSHHSSGRSSRTSGGSSAPRMRTSRSYFRGSRVYVRYTDRRPEYVYSNGDIHSSGNILFMIIIYAIFLLPLFTDIPKAFTIPTRLSWDDVQYTDPEIYDDADVLGDTSELMESLNDFRDTTGVIPVVVTLTNDEWKGIYSDMSNYAYNWYVYHYIDEKHWVVMYSEDPEATDTFGDWYWEGMQGDDTDKIVSDFYASKFTDRLHDNFIATGRMTRAEAIADAFDYIGQDIMDIRVDYIRILISLVTLAFIVLHILTVFCVKVRNKKKYQDYNEVKNVQVGENNIPLEDTCKYCDGIYVVGTVISCPHCGANIPAHNPINNSSYQ